VKTNTCSSLSRGIQYWDFLEREEHSTIPACPPVCQVGILKSLNGITNVLYSFTQIYHLQIVISIFIMYDLLKIKREISIHAAILFTLTRK
jgi:hypothetical protein